MSFKISLHRLFAVLLSLPILYWFYRSWDSALYGTERFTPVEAVAGVTLSVMVAIGIVIATATGVLKIPNPSHTFTIGSKPEPQVPIAYVVDEKDKS